MQDASGDIIYVDDVFAGILHRSCFQEPVCNCLRGARGPNELPDPMCCNDWHHCLHHVGRRDDATT